MHGALEYLRRQQHATRSREVGGDFTGERFGGVLMLRGWRFLIAKRLGCVFTADRLLGVEVGDISVLRGWR